MMKKIVRKILGEDLYTKYSNKYQMMKLCLKNKRLYNKIKSNKFLKDSHIGERCFIFGNGPSIKNLSFSDFAKEFVFTVNKYPFIDNYEKIKPNAHVLIDAAFFDSRHGFGESNEVLSSLYIKLLDTYKLCFVPLDSYSYLKGKAYLSKINFKFVNVYGKLSDAKGLIDISKNICVVPNVVLYAIQIAVYMGFQEIYLLGCEESHVIYDLEAAIGRNIGQVHAYNNEIDKSEEACKNNVETYGIVSLLKDYEDLFSSFEDIYSYCKKNGVLIRNCTPHSLIDSIPYLDIAKVIKKKI